MTLFPRYTGARFVGGHAAPAARGAAVSTPQRRSLAAAAQALVNGQPVTATEREQLESWGRRYMAAEECRLAAAWAPALRSADADTKQQAWRLAVHEAGHAVVGLYNGSGVEWCGIEYQVAGGRLTLAGGLTRFRQPDSSIAGCVAGACAEGIDGIASDWYDSSDYRTARACAVKHGLDVNSAIARAERATRAFLQQHSAALFALAEAVYASGGVSGLRAEAVIREACPWL